MTTIDPRVADQIDAVIDLCDGRENRPPYSNDPEEDAAIDRAVTFFATSMPFDPAEVEASLRRTLLMCANPAPPKPLLWRIYDAVARSARVLKWRVLDIVRSER